MSQHIQISQGLRVFESSYNADGSRAAGLPIERSRTLHTDSLCNKVLVRPPADLEGDEAFEVLLGTASLVTTPTGIVTATRPMGGSGHATVTGLIALDIIITALPLSTEEIESGQTVDRLTGGTISGKNSGESTTYFSCNFELAQPGEVFAYRIALPRRLASLAKLFVNFNLISQMAQLEIITVAESS